MPITFTPLEEGDGLSAASLNNRFSSYETEVNGLAETRVLDRSLNNRHYDSAIYSSVEMNWNPAPTVRCPSGNGAGGVNDHLYTKAGRTISDGTNVMSISFDQHPMNDSPTYGTLGGMLVLFDAHLIDFGILGGGSPNQYNKIQLAGIWLEWTPGGGIWNQIARSRRYLSCTDDSGGFYMQGTERSNIGFRTLITASDLGGSQISGVRVFAQAFETGGTAFWTSGFTLRECSLSLIPFYAKKV